MKLFKVPVRPKLMPFRISVASPLTGTRALRGMVRRSATVIPDEKCSHDSGSSWKFARKASACVKSASVVENLFAIGRSVLVVGMGAVSNPCQPDVLVFLRFGFVSGFLPLDLSGLARQVSESFRTDIHTVLFSISAGRSQVTIFDMAIFDHNRRRVCAAGVFEPDLILIRLRHLCH